MEEKHFGPVWFIPGETGGRYPFCHSVYIDGPGILIDPASDRDRLKQLREAPGVKTIWLSHWHEDHIMHLDLFDDLPLFLGEPDAPPISGIESFLDGYGMDIEEDRAHWRLILKRDFHFKSRRPTGFLRDGEILRFDGITIEVMSTPGHTPGHLSFFFRERGVLFMGDYDLFKFGPWYGDTESSIEQTIVSVNRLRNYPAQVWLTGHETGMFEQDPGETWDRYLDVISKREEKLYAFLEQPRTLEEIVGAWIIYGRPREPKPFFEFGERALMRKHVKRLLDQGRISETDGRYRRRSDNYRRRTWKEEI
ncbi:MAG: MBL fold metallo-hydrolase [Desulfobacterales bacterium]|nr:MBL fold metallo-hydrolase [Desulfobacterales bacterium]